MGKLELHQLKGETAANTCALAFELALIRRLSKYRVCNTSARYFGDKDSELDEVDVITRVFQDIHVTLYAKVSIT